MFKDRQFWAALAAALPFWAAVAWVRPPVDPLPYLLNHPKSFLMVVLVYPVLEEIIFRGMLQGWLRSRWPRSLPRPLAGMTYANLVTATVFAVAHALIWRTFWTLPVFAPALVYGYFRDRYDGKLAAPIALHVFYNAGFTLLVSPTIGI